MNQQRSSESLARNCLMGTRLQSVERSEYLWTFWFGNGSLLNVESLWRLISDQAIVLTSADHGQTFGLNHTIDAARELEGKIDDKIISDVLCDKATADMTICFGRELRLQLVNTSSGYEAWCLHANGLQIIGRNGDG